MVVFKTNKLNFRKRAIAVCSIALFLLSLIILNSNPNFLSLYGHILAQHIKIDDYNANLKKQQIQPQLVHVSNPNKATNTDTQTYPIQRLDNGIIQGAMTDP